MSLATLGTFLVVIAVLIAAPGPDWAFTLGVVSRRQSLSAAVTGLVIGYLGLTAVVALGVGDVLAEQADVLVALTLFGAAYLAWLGARAIRHPHVDLDEDVGQTARLARSRLAVAVAGIGVSCLNPKALLIFVAVLPQFTSQHAGWSPEAQLAGLGVTFAATVGAFYSLLGTLASRVVQQRPTLAAHLSRAAGVAMVLLAAALVVQHGR